jgi:phosphatidylinositol glycan class H protein
VLVFPPHGIQLETHRGYPLLKPLFVSRRFIHASHLEDFIINEGLRRWNVRYYLAVVHRGSTDMIAMDVAFEVSKPLPFPFS